MRPLAVARNRGVRDSSARLLALLGRLAGIVPAYLPLDFASYHIYPPVSTPAGGRAFVERETFLVAQGSCGQGLGPCGNGRMPAVVGEFGAGVSGSKFHYRGNVHDERLKGVPYAVLTGRLSGGGSVYFTVLADSKGNYDFHAPSSRR